MFNWKNGFTESDRFNPKKNDFGFSYLSTRNRNTEIIWFGFQTTLEKIKMPIYLTEDTSKNSTPKISTNNTENTNLKINY